ncbi:hypothetical protein [Amycolatopsis sp.]|uniref:hypothetical protein n=1 Tax=Amycolatopsis sp. TaxID=37632 RepID=UPI002D19AF78|nr:hypothetical protein [Amycolatopsis sp.]HVV09022.1 hypothetical protein [Amycolatopsis sp.]
MLTPSQPIATSPDQVWVFVSATGGAVDVVRLAHVPGSPLFVGLPIEAFDPSAVLPTYSATGELVEGYRWATAADVDEYAYLFAEQD